MLSLKADKRYRNERLLPVEPTLEDALKRGRPKKDQHLISSGTDAAIKFFVDTFIECDFLDESLKAAGCNHKDVFKNIRAIQVSCLWLYKNMERNLKEEDSRSKSHNFSTNYGVTCPKLSDEEICAFLEKFEQKR